jgi:predicted signal transduction protein with EAL and GGDEF domain
MWENGSVGTSIGIALSTNVHEGAEDLIRDADAAMHQAKQQGKNCYVFSDQSDIPREELLERWKRLAKRIGSYASSRRD